MHEQLILASSRVEALRRAQWGTLGVWWFWLSLRRAMRDVDGAPARDGKGTRQLAMIVAQQERALAGGREILRWLEGATAAGADTAPSPPAVDPWIANRTRRILAVVGAGTRMLGRLVRPVWWVLVIAVTVDADSEVESGRMEDDLDLPRAPIDSDVALGGWTLASFLASTLAAAGTLWWWYS